VAEDTGRWEGEVPRGGHWGGEAKGNGGEEFGALKQQVGEHERRLGIVDGAIAAHPVNCPAVKDVKDVVAWRNKWAGALMSLQILSTLLGLAALLRSLK
jgi:hypothetical protein